MPQHFDLSALQGAKRTDERQKGRLARSRRAGHHHELALSDLQTVIEQHLVTGIALAKRMVHMPDAENGGRCDFHQNTSAGSASRTRRIAAKPDKRHIISVSPALKNSNPAVS